MTKEIIAIWYLRIRNAEKRPKPAVNAVDPIVSLPYIMPEILVQGASPYNLNASHVHARTANIAEIGRIAHRKGESSA